MKHGKLNHNKAFMIGIMAMALVVIGVVIIFWMWCFPQGTPQEQVSARYELLLTGFRGDSLQVSINDQILYDGQIHQDSLWLRSDSPEDQVMLMVGDFRTDEMNSFEIIHQKEPYRLYREGGTIKIGKK